jgi:hypothetical protein
MSDQNFVVIGTTAVYNGVIDAFHINEAAKKAQRLAVTENIDGFEAALPNTEFDQFGVYAELKARGFKVLRSGEGETTVGYHFVRTVSIAVEVEQRSQPTVPAAMDLAGRRIV